MDLGQVTSVVVAVTGLVGAGTAYRLGKRGQRNDEQQQSAKAKLEERIAAFDELESINDRLEKENARLRGESEALRSLIGEAETRGDLRLAQQAARCRDRLDDLIKTVSILQGVVVSEMAKSEAGQAIEDAMRHVAADHPDEQPDMD